MYAENEFWMSIDRGLSVSKFIIKIVKKVRRERGKREGGKELIRFFAVKEQDGDGSWKATPLGSGSDADNLLLTSPCSWDPTGKVCVLLCN